MSKLDRSIGRRKTSNARVTISENKAAENSQGAGDSEYGNITVNGREFKDYFRNAVTRMVILQPLRVTERAGKYDVRITVQGGGVSGQAGAVLHGIARALQTAEPELRPALKAAGFLTRDPRAVERKKPGRHKARRSTQFSKR